MVRPKAWYNARTKDWMLSLNGELGRDSAQWLLDDDGQPAHFLTAQMAYDANDR